MRRIARNPAISRRAVLAGTGGLAVAAALDRSAVVDRDEPPPELADAVPVLATAEAPGGPPLALVPGFRFASWGATAFQPISPGHGRLVTADGAYTNLSDGYLAADLDLPYRSQLLAAQICALNTSGSAKTVWIESKPLTPGTGNAFGVVTVPSSAGVQTVFGSFSQVVDSAQSSYDATVYTYATGTVRIRSLRLGYQPAEQGFTPLTPTRVYDSRAGNPPLSVTKGPLANGSRVIDLLTGLLPGVGPYPRGVLVNLTVVNTSPSGFLSLYANGTSFSNTSSINWFVPGEIVANTTYTAIDTSGRAIAYVPANASTDFFIDRVGLFI
jgi:hypothetical protein